MKTDLSAIVQRVSTSHTSGADVCVADLTLQLTRLFFPAGIFLPERHAAHGDRTDPKPRG